MRPDKNKKALKLFVFALHRISTSPRRARCQSFHWLKTIEQRLVADSSIPVAYRPCGYGRIILNLSQLCHSCSSVQPVLSLPPVQVQLGTPRALHAVLSVGLHARLCPHVLGDKRCELCRRSAHDFGISTQAIGSRPRTLNVSSPAGTAYVRTFSKSIVKPPHLSCVPMFPVRLPL